ncbi:acyltransferase [Acetobacteraceae bacterium KSS8]|uniref:Acyltransferase n=1 Tax=Endosaccharibacter trunci TaxID=2812733 RepID=A0ABT1W8I0_9PROT|nr:acyltransferase [Acetobacteraceae bacterium KSS8]
MSEPAAGRGLPPALSRRRIADIEVLRAFAVSMVLFEHLPLNLVFWHSRLLWGVTTFLRGWVGVDLFFAISGFVIARGLLPELVGERDPTGFVLRTVRFWVRRAWRLLPTAWVWLLVPMVLCVAWNRSGALFDVQANFGALVAAVMDVANFRVGALFGVKPTGVAFPYWSLSLEEQFYLLLPVAIFLFRRWLALPLLALVVLQFWGGVTPLGMMVRPGAISLGVLLAMWEGSKSWHMLAPDVLGRSRLARWSVIGVLLFLMMALGNDGIFISRCRVALIAILGVALVWIASYGRGFVCQAGWARRPLLWLAARSYAIYVIHIPVYLSLHEAWFRWKPATAPHGWVAAIYVMVAFVTIGLLAWLNDAVFADRLRRQGAVVAAGLGTRGGAGCVAAGGGAT